MKGWKELGLVETIYEEEHEDCNCSSSSTSSCPSALTAPTSDPLSSPLQDIVNAWTFATGVEANILIHVQDQCFNLHKDPLTSRSGYLQRHLKDSTELTLSRLLKLTPETFTSVITFCYGSPIVITPFNVGALRVAAELLEMTADSCDDPNLKQKTENFFRQAVSVNRECATTVLRSCLPLLPEAELTASLVSRCIEGLNLVNESDEDVNGLIDGVMFLSAEEFQIIAESLHRSLTANHDLLYRIVDLYLKKQVEKSTKITEEQKIQISNLVDCEKLSPHLQLHAVQNPSMPLRFLVRAMFLEQLSTRRSIISMATAKTHMIKTTRNSNNNNAAHHAITLGAILQRDAALRQVAELKHLMERTSSKIESLERDLMGMKQQLRESEKMQGSEARLESSKRKNGRRSESFRLSFEKNRGDVIKESLRDGLGTSTRYSAECRKVRAREVGSSSSTSERSSFLNNENSVKNTQDDYQRRVGFGWKLMKGLKTAFGKSSLGSKQLECESCRVINGDGDLKLDEIGIDVSTEAMRIR
ncbi:hypothetical protein Syun_014610 [Stephania yunnanensis]|uniref:BTB/POZ domain-containing protein n=1 Tax=Stephania yunnanensis TaxID=152371 RepID=A0AAP0PC09_9MAGN